MNVCRRVVLSSGHDHDSSLVGVYPPATTPVRSIVPFKCLMHVPLCSPSVFPSNNTSSLTLMAVQVLSAWNQPCQHRGEGGEGGAVTLSLSTHQLASGWWLQGLWEEAVTMVGRVSVPSLSLFVPSLSLSLMSLRSHTTPSSSDNRLAHLKNPP